MANLSPATNAPASGTSSRASSLNSLQCRLDATRPIINGMYQKLKAHIISSAPAIASLLFFFLIVATVLFSFLAYLFVLISVAVALILLFVSLTVKLVAAIAVVAASSLAVRTISGFEAPMDKEGSTPHVDHKTSTSEVATGLKPISDETLKVLHHDYKQLCTAFPSLIFQSGLSVRALLLDRTTPPLGPSPYLSWRSFLNQIMNAIIEIDLTAFQAILSISGAIVTSVWSTSGSILGLPDTPRDINSVAPIEPSGTSTSVSL